MDVQLRALMESSGDAIFVTDAATGKVTDCNEAALLLLGGSRDRIVGAHHTVLYPAELREQYARDFELVAAGRTTSAVESQLLHANGESFWVETNGSVCEMNGRKLVVCIFRDTTERRAAKEELRRLNRILMAISACDEAILDASGESELQTRITELLVKADVCHIAALVCFHEDGPVVVSQSGRDGRAIQEADLPVLADVLEWPAPGAAAEARIRIAPFSADDLPRLSSWTRDVCEGPVCFVSLPINCAGQEAGALFLATGVPGVCEPQELEMLEKLAEHLRNGIETVRTRTERNKALEDLQYRLGFEAILSSAIREFFNLSGHSVDLLVQRAWARISEFLKIESSFCILFERDGSSQGRFEWHAGGQAHPRRDALDELLFSPGSWCRQELERGTPVMLCPEERDTAVPAGEQARCRELGIRSMLLVPIEDEGRLAGVQGLHTTTRCRSWAAEDVELLKSAGQVILGAVRRARTARLLEESEHHLRMILDAASNGVYDVDFSTGRAYYGENWSRMLGYEPHEIAPTIEACFALVHPEDAALIRQAFDEHVSGQKPHYQTEFRLRNKDGDYQWVLSRGKVVEWEGGRPKRLLGTHTDISDRKRIENALQWRDARHRALLQAIPDTLLRVRRDGEVFDVHAFDQAPLADMSRTTLGKRLFDVFPEVVAEQAMHHLHRALDQNQVQVFEFRTDVGGSARAFEARTVPTDESEAMLIIRDVSEHHRLELEILDVSERERERIGQDLHDGLGQQLVGISFLVDAVATELDRINSPLVENVRNIAALVAEAMEQSRSLARGLHITGLEGDGLAVALEELVNRTRSVYEVDCKLVCRGAIRLPTEEANQLYRIAQEAVTNAVRHARAKGIAVSLSQNERRVRLTIEDDGRGFDLSQNSGDGMGLHIMRYRAKVVSASLEIDSEPGQGSRIICSLPLLRRT